MTAETTRSDTARLILGAARTALLNDGYSGLSTRTIAEQAGVPLSQIHYHFGSKQNLVVAVLDEENQRLLERQEDLYAADLPMWRQWEQACDFLDDDVESGYVRVLHEMIAAGWSDPVVGAAVWKQMKRWSDLLLSVARRAASEFGTLGVFTPDELAALVAAAFVGAEDYVLLGVTEAEFPARSALRKIGALIRTIEEAAGDAG